jgi:hypothetical protein
MTEPSDDERLHIIKDDKPRPRLFQEDLPEDELRPAGIPGLTHSSFKRIATVIVIVLVIALLAAGTAYWIERHRYPVVVAIELPKKETAGDEGAALVPIKPEMLQVTSISLGEPRLAIVNGRELTEGETIVLKTGGGRATLRVQSIQDGMVRFRHGGQTLDVPLQAGKKSSPR